MGTIAVIEDDPVIFNLIEELLAREGHVSRTFHDGLHGVAAVMETLPDLVTCDVDLSGYSGFDVLSRLRSYTPTASVPFLFVTSHDDSAFRRQALRWGADGCVDKTRLRQDLVNMVRGQFARVTQSHELAARLFR